MGCCRRSSGGAPRRGRPDTSSSGSGWRSGPAGTIKLVKAGQKLAGLRTPNGEPIPPNTLAQLYRGLERLAVIRKQIKAIEQELRQRLKAKPTHGTNPLVLMLAKIFGLGLETA